MGQGPEREIRDKGVTGTGRGCRSRGTMHLWLSVNLYSPKKPKTQSLLQASLEHEHPKEGPWAPEKRPRQEE